MCECRWPSPHANSKSVRIPFNKVVPVSCTRSLKCGLLWCQLITPTTGVDNKWGIVFAEKSQRKCTKRFLWIGCCGCSCCTHIAQRRVTNVPKWSKRKPVGRPTKLLTEEATVKTREKCSSCPLQSVDTHTHTYTKVTGRGNVGKARPSRFLGFF